MANLKLKTPGGGSVALVSADTASDLTVTFPAVTGTAMVSGNQQGFSAWIGGGNQSVSATTWTKLAFNTTTFNLGNCYNTSTYRFTPTVAGYYQCNLVIYDAAGGTSNASASIYKNGAAVASNQNLQSTYQNIAIPSIIYLNGSTDYIEAYAYIVGATGSIISSVDYVYFQAMLIRNA